jgi:hypothetical protein
MSADSLPDANGHILTARAIELRDRYIVVEPMTQSVSSYKPYKPMIVAIQDCRGTPEGICSMAERVGFEPTVGFLLHTLSKRAP